MRTASTTTTARKRRVPAIKGAKGLKASAALKAGAKAKKKVAKKTTKKKAKKAGARIWN